MTSAKSFKNSKTPLVPLGLTTVTAGFFIFLVYLEIILLNKVTPENIYLKIQLSDILIGLTIYLKTSVDFAIFIGNLMSGYKGV
ncbi:MAG TPA: hypothetical protein VLG67_01765, partial [Candidatus Saccharimonadales bacterium]|nr:hypothetical protein [Candidatus Saccharimonadales bacterium]